MSVKRKVRPNGSVAEYVYQDTPEDRAKQTQRYLRRLARLYGLLCVPSVTYEDRKYTFEFEGELRFSYPERHIMELAASELAALALGIYIGKKEKTMKRRR